ncbi:solute carrier family 35 member G1-like [Dermacentor andersoni]|uniref:solute carrier family 35 member G1-like n=1 Tax=Dermacentor andersoni TaxID=34620 RepID=UPI003B3BA7BD
MDSGPQQVEARMILPGDEEGNSANRPGRAKNTTESSTVDCAGIPNVIAASADNFSSNDASPCNPNADSRTSPSTGLGQEVTISLVDTNVPVAASAKDTKCPGEIIAEGHPIPLNETKPRQSGSILPSLRRLLHSLSRPSGVAKMVRSYSCVDLRPLESESTENSSGVRQRGSGYHSLILGILLAGGTSAVLSLVNVIIKRLPTVSTLEVLTFMSFGVFIGILPTATEEVQPFGPRKAQPLLFARALLSMGSSILRLTSLSYLTIADSSITTTLTPLMVGITATLFLAEPFHWTQGVAMALSVLGITLVVKPTFLAAAAGWQAKTQYIGIAYGLSHAVLNGVTTVCIRSTKGVSRSVVVFHYGCLSMLLVSILSIAMGRLKVFYDGSQIGYLLLISHLTFALQMFLSKALQFESASLVTIIKTSSDVIFGFIMQAVFLNVHPDMFSVTGGSLILFGVLILGLRKIAQSADPQSSMKRKLRFLL